MGRFASIIVSVATALLMSTFGCSEDESTSSCDPTLPSSCGAVTAYCNASRQCQPCPTGSFNCDGVNTNLCESPTSCSSGGNCVPGSSSTCGTAQYCSGQTCTACPTNSYNCDLDDTNMCEAYTACGTTGNCVPSSASSCAANQYCAAQSCTPCGPNTYNCDRDDTNGCESPTPCTSGNCVPNDDGASSCGTSQYCVGQLCTTCAPNSYNCDKNDGNGCEATTPCGVAEGINAHLSETCKPELSFIEITPDQSTCETHMAGDALWQVILGEASGWPPATGRTYTVKSPLQVNIYPADGEATAVYLGPAGKGNAESGTFTIDQGSTGALRTGSYNMVLSNGNQETGSFRADKCPSDLADCED